MDFDFAKGVSEPGSSKIVLLVLDGLGGLPRESDGKTELEAANTPNLDQLAAEGICGLQQPAGWAVTPGSGPAHLGLFGYDAQRFVVGRGVLAALGVGFGLDMADVAARGNFCTVDDAGNVTDRRAGRIPTERGAELCALLQEQVSIDGVEVFIQPVKEYRSLLVLRGEELSGEISTTDPQQTGVPPLEPRALDSAAEKTVGYVKEFISQAREILKDHSPANMLLLRGFAMRPDWPTIEDVYGLRCAAIAAYPMYRGVAQLVGMTPLKTEDSFAAEMTTLSEAWNDHDFFYVHWKRTDSAGEDGDFDKKVALIEEVDKEIPRLRELNPDVIIVTGDHSTPSKMKSHSWHPVPTLLWSPLARRDPVTTFGETACISGGLGPRMPATELLPLAVAHAGRFGKFGA
ncbi:MAG: 2,3-bisphosphoglycerate-independent phosphoglycerate mutase [Chloroflexi bacterium]|nr:2,3-bisphosphoglycerate-independent phosphoglycerate mutase [Chloroflexota bacterium]